MENDKLWEMVITALSSGGLSAIVVKLLNRKSENSEIDIKIRDANVDSALEVSEAARQLLANVNEQLKQCQAREKELEAKIEQLRRKGIHNEE